MIYNIKNKFLPYLKNSGIYFGASLFVATIGVLLNPIYAINLTHEDYAVIGYYSSFNLLLMPLLHFSLFSFYSRHYYFTPEEKRQDLGDTILLSSIIIGFFSLMVFTSVFYYFHSKREESFPFFPYAILTFLQVYVGNTTSFYLIKLRVTRQAKQYGKLSISHCLLTTMFSLLFVVYYKYGAEGKLLGGLFSSCLVSAYALKKTIRKIKIDKDILLKGLKFSLPLTISAIFWYFLTGIDRIFLEQIGDKVTFGLYSIGISIAGYMTIFYTTVSNTFEPDIYQAIAQKRKKKLIVTMLLIIGPVTVLNLIFILLAPYVIGLLTANRYIEAAPFARILALQNITMAVYYMVVKLLIGFGYVKLELSVRIIGAGISVIFFYFLIHTFGFYGAAWGQVLSFLILSILGSIAFSIKRKIEKSK